MPKKEKIDPRLTQIQQYLESGEIKEGHYRYGDGGIEVSISKKHIFLMEIYNAGEKCRYMEDDLIMRDCSLIYEQGVLKLVIREKNDLNNEYMVYDTLNLELSTEFKIVSERISKIKSVSIEKYVNIKTIDGENICPGKSYHIWNAVRMAAIQDKITQTGFRGRKIKIGRQRWLPVTDEYPTERDVILQIW